MVAAAMSVVARSLADSAEAIRRAYSCIIDTPALTAKIDTVALWASAQRIDVLHEECRSAASNTLLMADVYEVVELRAQLAAMAIDDTARAFAVEARIAQLQASDPRVAEMEQWLLAGWEEGRFDGLDRQFDGQPFTGALNMGGIFALAAAVGARGFGRLPPNATLSGTAGAVSVAPVATATPLTPPTSLAEAFRRFPATDGAQLKVEKYTMPDGTSRFVLYAKGTQFEWPWEHDEPMDMGSNCGALHRRRSRRRTRRRSRRSRRRALSRATASHVFAHSQAAMNAATCRSRASSTSSCR